MSYRRFNQKEFDYLLKLYGDNVQHFLHKLSPVHAERLSMYKCALCWTRTAMLSGVSRERIRQMMNKIHRVLDRPINLRKLIDMKIKNRDPNNEIKEVVEYYEEMRAKPEKTTVVNIRTDNYDVSIMRPSIYGNPYRIGVDGTREEVLEKFRERLKNQPFLVQLAKERLKGKVLGCCCKPLPCHGDIWVEFIEGD